MILAPYPLDQTAAVALDAAGAGRLRFAPTRLREAWAVTRMTTAGGSTLEPTCQVFRGEPSSGRLLDTTRRGNAAVSETAGLALTGGGADYLTVVYAGGTPGAVMTFHIEGTVTTG
jgi:hypothetical protein